MALLKSVIKPLGLLGLTAASSAIDAKIHKRYIVSGFGRTTLIISNEEMNDIMKIAQALEDSGILLKGVTKTIKNETKEHKGGFLSMLLGTLDCSLIADVLTKNLFKGKESVKAGKETVRAGEGAA